ncbi:threonylcarbamoyl-AMP synthase [bacterium BMS3Bbin11]|nr:threonylcarbamoyl-AMP synthase [bacterium BMS3Abin11]GBE45553.1 threonylcarbamoyl-AMP synthase [bacterium BMS3Bbin11]GMT39965.1 MAG: threonylcarbamoyl-AMP synthase [bacterium]HDH09048.1 threonylcarbamoyl-AMP synthase [Gammaproteobacteria bacterium]HDH16331.1 threonylcarbamoyl-AMP synthase [Gammaproteobacteria bacterium]
MAQYFEIHPENPQQRLIYQAVEILNQGGVIVYPTDSSYALGCHIGDKQALNRIRSIRRVDARHNFTLVCRDLSELSTYAKVENSVYRLLKHYTPGAYTFILKATGEVPRRLQNPKRKTIGLRVPNNNITLALLEQLRQPIMSSTLILPNDEQPLSEPHNIREQLEHQVDLVIDGGFCGQEATTVIDMVNGVPEIIRRGKGDVAPFE